MKVKSDGSDFDFTIVTLLNQTMKRLKQETFYQ